MLPIKLTGARPLALLAAGAVGLAVAGWLAWRSGNGGPDYRLADVEKGALTATVSATGTVNAVTTVQVGSQVSGQIKELLADFNSEVLAGQVIARIDPGLFEARLGQAEADLAVAQAAVLDKAAQVLGARANLAVMKANSDKAEVALADARRDLERRTELFKKGHTAAADRDKAQAAYDSAAAALKAARGQEQAQEAALAAAEAQVETAKAAVLQKEAALRQARIDVEHTVIRAPVEGVVVSRNVDIGQTVAASLQAPILFLIAQDLRRMQIHASVDEADVGRIAVGQKVSFTIDAFPEDTFAGIVEQIRKAPQVVQNVVTYTVVVTAANDDLRLLPGMTANLKLVVAERADALKVPNAALRYRPSETEKAKNAGRSGEGKAKAAPGKGRIGRVWVADGGSLKPVDVRLGISDGSFTEVLDGALRPGQKVITATTAPPAARPGGPGLRLGF